MEEQTSKVSDSMEGFEQPKVDYRQYETSFRRWIVQEVESGRMSWQEVRARFNMSHRFDRQYLLWQKQFKDQIVVTLPILTIAEQMDTKKAEQRIKELEKELEKAQLKVLAMNVLIDLAEKEYKFDIRKKCGPKQ